MREIVIEENVVQFAESKGWLVRKVTYAGRRGAPDRWFFRGGKTITVEFKRRGQEPDGLQKREHEKLTRAGIPVYVIDSIDGGRALFDSLG